MLEPAWLMNPEYRDQCVDFVNNKYKPATQNMNGQPEPTDVYWSYVGTTAANKTQKKYISLTPGYYTMMLVVKTQAANVRLSVSQVDFNGLSLKHEFPRRDRTTFEGHTWDADTGNRTWRSWLFRVAKDKCHPIKGTVDLEVCLELAEGSEEAARAQVGLLARTSTPQDNGPSLRTKQVFLHEAHLFFEEASRVEKNIVRRHHRCGMSVHELETYMYQTHVDIIPGESSWSSLLMALHARRKEEDERAGYSDLLKEYYSYIDKQLEGFVGVEKIRQRLEGWADEAESTVRKAKKKQIKPVQDYAGGIILAGPAGTGKTTAAKIIRDCLHKFGFISNANWVQMNNFQAHYSNQVVEQFKEKLATEAAGGVWFVDEAYQLVAPKDQSSAGVAKLILAQMLIVMDPAENTSNRLEERVTFIFAGYEPEMLGTTLGVRLDEQIYKDSFIGGNEGLERRCAIRIILEAYSDDDLAEIVMIQCQKPSMRIKQNDTNIYTFQVEDDEMHARIASALNQASKTVKGKEQRKKEGISVAEAILNSLYAVVLKIRKNIHQQEIKNANNNEDYPIIPEAVMLQALTNALKGIGEGDLFPTIEPRYLKSEDDQELSAAECGYAHAQARVESTNSADNSSSEDDAGTDASQMSAKVAPARANSGHRASAQEKVAVMNKVAVQVNQRSEERKEDMTQLVVEQQKNLRAVKEAQQLLQIDADKLLQAQRVQTNDAKTALVIAEESIRHLEQDITDLRKRGKAGPTPEVWANVTRPTVDRVRMQALPTYMTNQP